MYEECLSCGKLGTSCDGPNFLAMSAHDLLEWCKTRKHKMGLSNAELSGMSNVPKGTIDRLLAGDHSDFKYETIRPLIHALVGGKFDDNPCPAPEEMARVEELERENRRLVEVIQAKEKEHEKIIIELKDEHKEDSRFLRGQVRSKNIAIVTLGILLGIALSVVITFLTYDYLNRDRGLFWVDEIDIQFEEENKEEIKNVLSTGKRL